MTAAVQLLNPLPIALAHYQSELTGLDLPVEWAPVAHPGVEGTAALPVRARAHIRAARASADERPLLSLWPAFGHLDLCLLPRGPGSAVVFHDPRPLRKQRGYGAQATRLGVTAARRRDITLVAHSRRAEAHLREAGYSDVRRVPHPVGRLREDMPGREPVVRVLGQFKSTRDLDLLSALGELIADQGLRTEVHGRGWPRVGGWDVHDAFVTEQRFDELVATSAVLLIPYNDYYQSGVAVRALELGTPVVGPQGGFLSELLGADWAGLAVDGSSAPAWTERVVAAAALTDEMTGRHAAARNAAESGWSAFLLGWAA